MRSLVFVLLFIIQILGQAMASNDKIILGYIEKVTLLPQDLTLSAKLDTGAKTASLNAIKITQIDVHGVPYLRFIVPSKAGDITFQCEYIGKVSIKVRAGEIKTTNLFRKVISRPVVLMRMQLAGQERLIRVNLTNRKRFIYPLLLGRDAIIAFHGVIDPARRYIISSLKNGEVSKV